MTPVDAFSDSDPLSDYVREHAERALDLLARLSRAEPQDLERELAIEAVHESRTSLRRLRAMLRTAPGSFEGTLLTPAAADRDLRFVARALGELRDLDVLGQQLLEEIETLPGASAAGRLREELAVALDARRHGAISRVEARRPSPRWRRAIAQLDAWRLHPPRLVEDSVLGLLESARADVHQRLLVAGGDAHALHSVRKAAKRWRYGAEMLLPLEARAAAHHEAATVIHVRLGQMQDAVVAAGFLRELIEHEALEERSRAAALELQHRAERRIDEIVAEAPHLL